MGCGSSKSIIETEEIDYVDMGFKDPQIDVWVQKTENIDLAIVEIDKLTLAEKFNTK